MAGSEMAPSTSEHTVTPSWIPAIMCGIWPSARSVVRASRDPAWARGSI